MSNTSTDNNLLHDMELPNQQLFGLVEDFRFNNSEALE